jgi:hypothetical protein
MDWHPKPLYFTNNKEKLLRDFVQRYFTVIPYFQARQFNRLPVVSQHQ